MWVDLEAKYAIGVIVFNDVLKVVGVGFRVRRNLDMWDKFVTEILERPTIPGKICEHVCEPGASTTPGNDNHVSRNRAIGFIKF